MRKKREDDLSYHTAVRYGNYGASCAAFLEQDNDDDDVNINQVDSKDRTAMDLAAQTGPLLKIKNSMVPNLFYFIRLGAAPAPAPAVNLPIPNITTATPARLDPIHNIFLAQSIIDSPLLEERYR